MPPPSFAPPGVEGKRKSDDVPFRPVSSEEIGAPRLACCSCLQRKRGPSKSDVGRFLFESSSHVRAEVARSISHSPVPQMPVKFTV